jgi:hypothetical protein
LVEEITARFGIEPTRVTERGEPVSLRDPHSKLRDVTVWALESRIDELEPLASHLVSLLEQVEPMRPALVGLIDEGCELEWSCYLEARPLGSMTRLGARLVARLAGLGGDIVLDVYDSDPA